MKTQSTVMTVSPPIGIPWNLSIANAVTRERCTLMLPCLSFISLLIFSVLPLSSSAHLTGTEFFAASTVTSLWKSLLPKFLFGKPCRKHQHFRSFQEPKTESQTPPSSRKSHAKRAKGNEDKSKEVSTSTCPGYSFTTGLYQRKQHCILARMAMWMLSFSKPCVIPLSETQTMFVWAMHCAVLLEGLRTTATLIVFLLCSHNSFSDSPNSASLVVAFLCRNSVSPLVRSYHLSSCLKQPFLISTNLFDHFSSFCHSSHNTICASW